MSSESQEIETLTQANINNLPADLLLRIISQSPPEEFLKVIATLSQVSRSLNDFFSNKNNLNSQSRQLYRIVNPQVNIRGLNAKINWYEELKFTLRNQISDSNKLLRLLVRTGKEDQIAIALRSSSVAIDDSLILLASSLQQRTILALFCAHKFKFETIDLKNHLKNDVIMRILGQCGDEIQIEKSGVKLDSEGLDELVEYAIEYGNVAALNYLYMRNYDLNTPITVYSSHFRGDKTYSLLHLACEHGQLAAVNFLLDKEVKFLPGNGGKTPLHIATACGQTHIVDTLIQRGTKLNCLDDEGNSALGIACHQLDVNMVRLLLNAQDINYTHENKNKETPLSRVTSNKNSTNQLSLAQRVIVSLFIKKDPTLKIYHPRRYSLISSPIRQSPLLHFACEFGMVTDVQYLLNQEIDIDEVEPNCNDTALAITVISNRPNIAELLLAAGVNVNAINKSGLTALHHSYNNPEMTELLLNSPKIALDIVDENGSSPLAYGLIRYIDFNKAYKFARALLSKGAKVTWEVLIAIQDNEKVASFFSPEQQRMLIQLIELYTPDLKELPKYLTHQEFAALTHSRFYPQALLEAAVNTLYLDKIKISESSFMNSDRDYHFLNLMKYLERCSKQDPAVFQEFIKNTDNVEKLIKILIRYTHLTEPAKDFCKNCLQSCKEGTSFPELTIENIYLRLLCSWKQQAQSAASTVPLKL